MSDNQITVTLNQSHIADLVALLTFVSKNVLYQCDRVERVATRKISQAFDDYLSCTISKDEMDAIRLEATEFAVVASTALQRNHSLAEFYLSFLTAAGVTTPGDNAHPEQPAAGLSTGLHTTFSTESVDNV